MIPANEFLSLSPDQITPESEEEFFTSLRLRNGTYKTTCQRRFQDINETLLRLVGSGDINVNYVLDIGISSGSNTLELYEELDHAGYKSQIIGTDLSSEAYLIRVFPGCFALLDDTGYPLRYDIFKLTMKPWVVNRDYLNGIFILRKCVNVALGHRARKLMAKFGPTTVRRVALITPMLRDHPNVVIQKDDITRYNYMFDGKFNFIRAANVLNRGYFSDAAIMLIVDNIRRYLAKPKATLLILRTHADGANHGTLFDIEQDGGCRIRQRFGRGSEVEKIVLECMSAL